MISYETKKLLLILSEAKEFFMVVSIGVEPTTLSLGRTCSIQLSYETGFTWNARHHFILTRL